MGWRVKPGSVSRRKPDRIIRHVVDNLQSLRRVRVLRRLGGCIGTFGLRRGQGSGRRSIRRTVVAQPRDSGLANAARLQGLYMHAADLLERRGVYAAELFAEQVNVLWLVQVLRAIGGSLQGILSFCIVTFVFVILGLLEVEPLGRRLRRIGHAPAIDTAAEIAARLQTYMLVRLGMSVLTGLAFWAFALVDGLELQREWGVIAFVLNFIPFIGSFVATLLPTLFAAAQFESLYAAFVVFIGLNLLQFVIGSYIEPRVAGTAVSVSPFIVLFAVFFWGMLWGIAGAFIGVPILIALATVCARHPQSRPIAVLLSADGTTQVKTD